MSKKCKNCGRPMIKLEDFANNDINSEYCNICLKEDGSLRTYKEFRNIMVIHLLTKEGRELTKQLGLEEAKTQDDAEKLADWVMKLMTENIPELKSKKSKE